MTEEKTMLAQMQCRPGPEAKAFEAWLRQSLSERFDETLVERLPGELAGLARQFDS